MKRNSVIEKMKKDAASNSLTINTVDNKTTIKVAQEEAVDIEVAMNWGLVIDWNSLIPISG